MTYAISEDDLASLEALVAGYILPGQGTFVSAHGMADLVALVARVRAAGDVPPLVRAPGAGYLAVPLAPLEAFVTAMERALVAVEQDLTARNYGLARDNIADARGLLPMRSAFGTVIWQTWQPTSGVS